MNKIKHYFSTHFSSFFVLILFAAFSMMFLFFHGYLQQAYFRYLLELNYEEENTIMHYVQGDLNQTLKDLILQGSRTSVSQEIYRTAEAAEKDEGSARLNDLLNLTALLKIDINAGEAVVEAVVSADGLVAQYDRLKKTTQTVAMWSPETYETLQEMLLAMTCEIVPANSRVLPRVWIYTEPSSHPSAPDQDLFHIILPMTGGLVSVWDTRLALVNTYSSALLTDKLAAVNIPQVDYVEGYITGPDGTKLFSTRSDLQQSVQNEQAEEAHEAEDVTAAGGQPKLLTADLDYLGLKLNINIDEEAMWKYVSARVQKIFVIGLGFLALVMSLIWILFNHMMRPVRLLSESMKEAEAGVKNTQIQIEGKHEIWQVAEEYNRMIQILQEQNAEIDRQHQRALRSIEQQHAAEWEALESQINAHFICNTLGCINYEAIEAGNHEVSLLLKKLSNILRYTFDQKQQEVMLFQEIAWVDQYLYLQKLRREDLFDYTISFPEVYGHWPCCKLMFQPFVENSIMHGFEGRSSGGMICIRIDREDGRLKVIIEDNGCGMNAQQAEQIRQMMEDTESSDPVFAAESPQQAASPGRTGVGIRNVMTRMRMFYGTHFDAELWTKEGEGTRFTFHIPIPETDEDQDE